ncbi:Glycosyltransferase, GT2 family [Loktanella fryxellensis]|uniref:Glycosyltransferase, GT2 family n=1 Tax=Loktanella fryxellensis TaxID=245187 RepID=A0A1H8IZJ8_9RHOB|nr:hypothetical protein [Loktanella fryxellensis]SEN73861.1 Glycosyltransferase, GT2 family [Loktanella fryxellensis]
MTMQAMAATADESGDGAIIIQPAIWPERAVSTQELPYVVLDGAAGLSLDLGGITFGAGGTARTDTYFNLFNLGKWRRFCGDMPLGLQLRGQGRFHLTIFMAADLQFQMRQVEDSPFADRIFGETVTLDGLLTVPLTIAQVDPRCVLFFVITALGDGRLDDFGWTTSTPPRQRPDLVLSVTTFRREAEVMATMDRFRRFRAASRLRDHIRMFVIDNGRSVTAIDGDGVTLFGNANLGGAGGFTRGLLEAQAAGATHCLFMDDDASVHMGAVTRTWMMLAYSRDPKLAVAGAMLDGDSRWQMWENGATFHRGCRPLYHHADLRRADTVLAMEFATTDPVPQGFYGGWWYFAFPLAQVTSLPFPFFVRGDDVSFSLANDFSFVTLPGVASVQQSFIDKASPTTWYLDMRSHLAHHLSLKDKDVGWWGLQRMFLGFYLRTVLRFHYDSLSAVNLAIEDVLRGPEFFAETADMAQRRGDLKALTTTEVWAPVVYAPQLRRGWLNRPMRMLLLLTLNGHLLPLSTWLGTRLTLPAISREDFRLMYGAREITFLNAQRTASYTVRRDRRRFWRESLRLLRNTLRLRRDYDRIATQWRSAYPTLTGRAFWADKLGL